MAQDGDPRIGELRVSRLLGRGATAEVYEVHHPLVAEPLALKLFDSQALGQGGAALLQQEVRAVAQLDHPCIARVIDQGVTGPRDHGGPGRSYILMERGEGTAQPLRGRVDWPTLRALLVAVLDGLAHAHARGLMHRDLKPSNLLRGTARSAWALADFGLASRLEELDREDQRVTFGTPGTMAPEQIDPAVAPIGPWTDLYALGCTAWALVTGHSPFGGENAAAIFEAQLRLPPPAFEPLVPVPSGLEAWLRQLLAKNPMQRFLRAAHAHQALCALDEEEVDPPTHAVAARRGFGARGLGLGLWGLRPTPLVGRDLEARRLREAWGKVLASRSSQVVWIRGPAGVGKSALAEAFVRDADASGRATVWRSASGEGATGLAGLLGRAFRLRGEGRWAGAPDHPWPEAPVEAALLGRWLDRGVVPLVAERHALLRWALSTAPIAASHVVWIDDAHTNLDALGFVDAWMARPGPEPVLFVLSSRDDAQVASAEATAALGELPAERLDLGPLTPVAMDHLLREVLGLHGEVAADVAARAAGNPLYAIQVVDHWVQGGVLRPDAAGFRAAMTLRTPESVAQVWVERVDAWLASVSAEQALAMEAAAVIGEDVALREWRQVCDRLGVPIAWAPLDRLLDERLAREAAETRSFQFAHPMLRKAIEDHARRHGRLDRVRQVVLTLLEARDDAQAALRRAELRLAMNDAGRAMGDLAVAARRLLEAVDDRRLALVQRWADEALELEGDDALDGWVRVKLCGSLRLMRRGHVEESRKVFLELQEVSRRVALSPAARADLAAREAALLAASGQLYKGAVVLRAARADLERSGDADALATLDRSLARNALLRGEPAAAAGAARAVLGGPASRRAKVDALGMLGAALMEEPAHRAEARAALDQAVAEAEALGMRHVLSELWTNRGEVARLEGDHPGARAAYERGAAVASLQGAPESAALAWTGVAMVEVDCGRFDDASQAFERARAGVSVEVLQRGLEAAGWACRVLAGDPSTPGVWEGLAADGRRLLREAQRMHGHPSTPALLARAAERATGLGQAELGLVASELQGRWSLGG